MSLFYFLLGLSPIIWLTIGLMILKLPTFKAAFGSLLISALLAMFVWKLPVPQTLTAALEGFLMALWPIILVIIAAVFTYNLSCKTKGMDTIKQMITSVSSDKRILVLLIAWCFGGFMEGMAGFGTAIAIPASMLVSLGFDPIFSCLVCLLANGTPTPFGSIGIPTVTLANLVGLTNTDLSFMTTAQLAPFMLLCPFLIVMVTGKGVKALKGMIPITLATGISFVFSQLLVAKFVGAELAVVVGSVCSLLVTIALAIKKKPDPAYEIKIASQNTITLATAFKAWSPFLLIFVFLLATSKLVPPIQQALSVFSTSIAVFSGKNPATLTFSWINTPGVWIFLSAFIGGIIQKATLKEIGTVLLATINQMKETMITMLCVLGCAKIMGYAGMIASISSFAIGAAGSLYPIFAPWIGALGTFVTGSGTNSGVLFGAVQLDASKHLHINPYWMVALNSLGVAAGKMLSPQSLAIGLSSADAKGQDSKLLAKILPYGIAFLIGMSALAFIGARIFG